MTRLGSLVLVASCLLVLLVAWSLYLGEGIATAGLFLIACGVFVGIGRRVRG